MTRPSFDLQVRRCVPIRAGDHHEKVSLRHLYLRAHELDDIEVTLPPAAAGLWRVLTVIAARITGLADSTLQATDWHDRRAEILDAGHFDSRSVKTYFDKYRSRFDLFDPQRPWLQDPRLATQCPKTSGINKLVLGRPAGQNQVWFNHHTEAAAQSIPANDALWYLLAQLYYGPSGRCTSRTVAAVSEANTTAGPLRSVASFHALGRSVFESLVTGIPYPGRYPDGIDIAPWEADDLPDPLAVPPQPGGVATVLAGRFQHAILLVPSADSTAVTDAYLTWAWRHKCPPAHDPYLIYQASKEGQVYARPASADRALWRDLDALLLSDVGEKNRHRPEALDDAEWLPWNVLDALRVRCFGFDQDGQTRDRQWFTATTPPVLGLLTRPQQVAGISQVRISAERTARHLSSALRTAWIAINDPSNGNGPPVRKKDPPVGPWPGRGAQQYWPEAERLFWKLVGEENFDDPAAHFVRLALDVYEQVTDHAAVSPRKKRAIERARGYIFAARGIILK